MGEQQIDKKAKQRIYAIGARLGIVGHGHEDDLHALVAALTRAHTSPTCAAVIPKMVHSASGGTTLWRKPP